MKADTSREWLTFSHDRIPFANHQQPRRVHRPLDRPLPRLAQRRKPAHHHRKLERRRRPAHAPPPLPRAAKTASWLGSSRSDVRRGGAGRGPWLKPDTPSNGPWVLEEVAQAEDGVVDGAVAELALGVVAVPPTARKEVGRGSEGVVQAAAGCRSTGEGGHDVDMCLWA